jgi:hypothetical protein
MERKQSIKHVRLSLLVALALLSVLACKKNDQPLAPEKSDLKFLIGDRVKTTANLNVREGPSTAAALLGIAPLGIEGIIIDGPNSAYHDGYTWWKVKYNNGMTGWSVENYLVRLN